MQPSRRRWSVFSPVLKVEEVLVGPAVAAQLTALHVALERFWVSVGRVMSPPQPQSRIAFELGVAEIAANIVRYAYPPPTRSVGEFEVRLQLYPDRLEALLSDQGQPFGEPGPTDFDPNDLPEGGFGLPLARRALDRVEYTRTPDGLNCWRLVKRL